MSLSLRAHRKDVRVAHARHAPMKLLVHRFEIEQHQIGRRHQPVKLLLIRLVLAVGLSRRVQHGMHALLMRQFKQLRDKCHLQHRLAAADGDSALLAVPAPIPLISKRLVQQFLRGHGLCGFARPCIRIVAELTPERTALQKNH